MIYLASLLGSGDLRIKRNVDSRLTTLYFIIKLSLDRERSAFVRKGNVALKALKDSSLTFLKFDHLPASPKRGGQNMAECSDIVQ